MNKLCNLMIKHNPFKEITFTALKKSYIESQMLNLSFDRNVTKMIEYFITVNLCKELLNWNKKNHYQYKIEAEKSTYELYKDCFENFKLKENTFCSPTIFASDSKEFKENLKEIRKGKVDIALSKENISRNISEYIFEVKAINPSITELKKDFKRIKKYLNTEIPHFENSLKGGFIVFIKHHNNKRKIQNSNNLIQGKEKYINLLNEKLSIFKDFNIALNIYCDTIDLSDYESLHVFEGDDFGEVAYRTFFAFAVIIEIQKISTTDKNILLKIKDCSG